MKKRFLNLLLIGSLSLTTCCYLTACSGGDDEITEVPTDPDPEEPEQPDKPDKPDVPKPGKDGEFPDNEDVKAINKIIPMDLRQNLVEGDNSSVGIEVTDVQERNFVFKCTPGESVASYRLDVFPLSILYNSLLDNYMANHPGATQIKGWTADDVENVIRSFMQNKEGAAAYIFAPEEGKEDEYFEREFDWGNSQYLQFSILPGCKYVVCALSCSDNGGMSGMNLSLCYLETPQQDLNGDPRVDIKYEAGYKSFKVSCFPNSDCVYFSHFGTNQDQVDLFTDNLGEQMLSEWLRHIYKEPLRADQAMIDADGDGEPDNSYGYNFGENADSELYVTAFAVGMDANYTGNNSVDRVDFHLKPMPEEIEEADAEVVIKEDRVGSDIFYFDINFTKACPTVFYDVMTRAEAESLMNGSEEAKQAKITELKEGGWGRGNKNYVWDNEKEQVSASSKEFTYHDYMTDIRSNTEYVVLYVAMNHFYQNKGLQMSAPVKTKAMSYDFAANKSNLQMELTEVTRTGATVNLTYDPKNTGVVYMQYYTSDAQSDPTNEIPSDDATDKEWADWLLYNQIANSNKWACESSGKDNYGLYGVASGTWLVFVATATDMNGVLSKPIIQKVLTKEATPGPNPEIKMEYTLDGDNFKVDYSIVKDVEIMKIGLADCGDDNYNNYFQLKQLVNGNPVGNYKDYQKAWKKAAQELSMDAPDNTKRDFDFSDEKRGPVIAWGYATGLDNGELVESEPQYLIAYKDNSGKVNVKTLEDYFPGTKAKVAHSVKSVYRPKSVKRNMPVRRDHVIPMVKNVTRNNLPFGYKLIDMRRVGIIK